jgi:antitoxin MazE
MNVALKTRIVKLGNSRGIRIPKLLLEQAGMDRDVEMEVRSGELIIRASQHPRAGWDEMCKEIVASGEGNLLDGDDIPATEWEINEWEW